MSLLREGIASLNEQQLQAHIEAARRDGNGYLILLSAADLKTPLAKATTNEWVGLSKAFIPSKKKPPSKIWGPPNNFDYPKGYRFLFLQSGCTVELYERTEKGNKVIAKSRLRFHWDGTVSFMDEKNSEFVKFFKEYKVTTVNEARPTTEDEVKREMFLKFVESHAC